MSRALTYLGTRDNGEHDDAVAQFLMGLQDTLPEGLAPPDPAIPVDVKDVVERLLRTDRPGRSGTGERPAVSLHATIVRYAACAWNLRTLRAMIWRGAPGDERRAHASVRDRVEGRPCLPEHAVDRAGGGWCRLSNGLHEVNLDGAAN